MNISLSSFFFEEGVSLDVSHKVYQLIREKIVDTIILPLKLDDVESEWTIGIDLRTSRSTVKLNLEGPNVDKKNKFRNYYIWLPYHRIQESENFLESFLDYYFEGLKEIFKNYEVKEGAFDYILDDVKSEVLDNPEFNFSEEIIPPPDLSNLDF